MKMKMSGNNALAFSISLSLSEKPHVLATPPPGLSVHFVASNKRRLPLIIVITPSPCPRLAGPGCVFLIPTIY